MRIDNVKTIDEVKDFLSEYKSLNGEQFSDLPGVFQSDILRVVIDSDLCEFDNVWPEQKHIPKAESMLMRALAQAAAARQLLKLHEHDTGKEALYYSQERVDIANEDVVNLLLDSLVPNAVVKIDDVFAFFDNEAGL